LTGTPADVLAVVHLADPGFRERVEGRAQALTALYGPPGEAHVTIVWRPAANALVVALGPGNEHPGAEDLPLWWNLPPGPALARPEALLEASDATLRKLPTPSLLLSWTDGRVRVATSCGTVQTLYEAGGAEVRAWSTHAAAAAVLALERVEIDPLSVAEQVGCEFVGGTRTMLVGVRALSPGTIIDLEASSVRERSCFENRLVPMSESEARETAERALLADLEEATRDARAPVVGLTAGFDSRTAAVALVDLGVPFVAFTFTEGLSAGDMETARALAAELGVPHLAGEVDFWRDEEGGLDRMLTEAVRLDGCAELRYGEVGWPPGMDRWVTGLGSEARAFYWGWASRGRRQASAARVTRVLRIAFEGRLIGAERERLRELRDRWAGWVAEAEAAGHRGWAALDFVLAHQRDRSWTRSQLLHTGSTPSFAGAELTRAVLSMPLTERPNGAWQRDFIAARRPDLVPLAPTRRPWWSIAPVATQRVVHVARGARRALRLERRGRTESPMWYESPPWRERPAYVSWLIESLLESPLLVEALGESWVRERRSRFLAGDAAAGEALRLAGQPVALQQALLERLAPHADRIGLERGSDKS
jgi:hypothetical protein